LHEERIKIKCIVINYTCVLMCIAVRNAKYVFRWQQKWRGHERVHIVAAQTDNCTCVLMCIAVRNAKYVFRWQQKWRGCERVHIVAAQTESWGPSHCACVTEHLYERLFVKLVLNHLIALTDIWGVLVNI